ncbi:MAG TPA: hypothetical protein VI251_05145 [Pseudolabrys sp.]|jgi:hypothetical protein
MPYIELDASDGLSTYFVNTDAITYVQQKREFTFIHFGKDHGISVTATPDVIIEAADRGLIRKGGS